MARKRANTPDDSALHHELHPLVQAVAERRMILFAGGGVSQNLGVPDFRTVVHYMASDLGLRGNYSVAEYAVVAEAYLVKHAQLGALRSWMDTTWHPATINIAASELHNLIIDLGFRTIYTTNYDRWLEKSFEVRRKPFQKITNAADLTVPAEGRTEIIKFHGDFQDDDSLVLTESSYFQRMQFETPLDLRLRSDSLARPLFFVGYSLHDINTRYLLFRLQEMWKNSPHADQRPTSYILMTERNEAQEIVLKSRGVQPIPLDGKEPGRATIEFLRDLLNEVRRFGRRSPARSKAEGGETAPLKKRSR